MNDYRVNIRGEVVRICKVEGCDSPCYLWHTGKHDSCPTHSVAFGYVTPPPCEECGEDFTFCPCGASA